MCYQYTKFMIIITIIVIVMIVIIMMMIIIILIFIIIIIKGIVQWTFHKLALLLLQLLPKVRVLKNKSQEKLLINLTAPLHVQYSSACNKQKSHFNLTSWAFPVWLQMIPWKWRSPLLQEGRSKVVNFNILIYPSRWSINGQWYFVKAYTFKVILSKVKIKAHLRKWN